MWYNSVIEDRRDVVNKLVDFEKKIQQESESDMIDKEKIFKLKYQQLLEGLKLQFVDKPNLRNIYY